MASSPKETIYGPFDNSAWINIPATIAALRRMEIVEVPIVTNNVQQANAPQGLQYQRFDPTTGQWSATEQALPDEVISCGDGMTVIGWSKQSDHFGNVRAADVPVRVRSGTATQTQVRVREWSRAIALVSST
jgi:hypothetical protein